MHLAVAALLSIGAACTEPPERQELQLCLESDGGLLARLEVTFDGEEGEPESALRARLEDSRRSLENGTTPWVSRFASLGPLSADGEEVERLLGRIERFERWAAIEDASRLDAFFADTPLRAFVDVGRESGELLLVPTVGSRADRAQHTRVERAFERTARDLAEYWAAVGSLYERLESLPPERSEARARVLSLLVEEDQLPSARDLDPISGDPDSGEPDSSEPSRLEAELLAMLRAIRDHEAALLKVFELPKDEAYSLQEASRLVFDPFPADVLVRVPGRVVEVAGFRADAGAWRVRRVGFWDAVERLRGRWVSPDPLLEKLDGLDSDAVDTDAGSAAPLRFRKVLVSEVRDALWRELAPWDEYALRWRSSGDGAGCHAPSE